MANINRAHLGSLSTVTALNVFPPRLRRPVHAQAPRGFSIDVARSEKVSVFLSFFFFRLVFVLNVLRPGVSITRYKHVSHVTMRLYLDRKLTSDSIKTNAAQLSSSSHYVSFQSFSTNKSWIFFTKQVFSFIYTDIWNVF